MHQETEKISNFRAFHFHFPDVLAYAAEKFITVVFPDKCLACGSFYEKKQTVRNVRWDEKWLPDRAEHVFHQLAGQVFCRECRKGFVPVTSPACKVCGVVFKSRAGEDRICSECIKKPKYFTRASAAAVFEGPVVEMVHKLKYNGKMQLVPLLSILLWSAFLKYAETELAPGEVVDRIVPVPLHRRRLKERGFNQAFLLVREWEKVADGLALKRYVQRTDHSLLHRKRNTASQTGLGKEGRRKNIKNAFWADPASDIRGERILLIDDVYTTGATVNECARVLRKKGAGRVDVLTVARTI